MNKPKVCITGFDTLENTSFWIEVDTAEDIIFTGAFVECFDQHNNYQIPIEYIDRIIVCH